MLRFNKNYYAKQYHFFIKYLLYGRFIILYQKSNTLSTGSSSTIVAVISINVLNELRFELNIPNFVLWTSNITGFFSIKIPHTEIDRIFRGLFIRYLFFLPYFLVRLFSRPGSFLCAALPCNIYPIGYIGKFTIRPNSESIHSMSLYFRQ